MSGYIGNIPVPQATQTRDNFTATSGQTTFSTSGYTPSYLDVYLNGVHLDPSDYTATNGTDVVLGTGATAGDIVSVVAFSTFEAVDQDFSGDFSVDGSTFVVDSTNNRVGIGTSSPDYQIDIEASSPTARLNSTVTNGVNTLWFGHSDDADAGAIRYWGSASGLGTYANAMTFNTNGSQAMHIDSSGNVGIGTSSPSSDNGTTVFAHIGSSSKAAAGLVLQDDENKWEIISNGNLSIADGTSERMRIDSSGRVTMPYQPNFVAYRGTGSWYSTTTERKMEFTHTLLNVGNSYNTSNYRFTAPVAGTYKFELIVYSRNDNTSDSSDYATIQLRLNGASSYTTHAYWIMHYKNNGDGDANFVMPYTVYLNAGDYVEPYYVAQSGSFSWHHTNSRFTGYLLG